jgi:hypothetical protein
MGVLRAMELARRRPCWEALPGLPATRADLPRTPIRQEGGPKKEPTPGTLRRKGGVRGQPMPGAPARARGSSPRR